MTAWAARVTVACTEGSVLVKTASWSLMVVLISDQVVHAQTSGMRRQISLPVHGWASVWGSTAGRWRSMASATRDRNGLESHRECRV